MERLNNDELFEAIDKEYNENYFNGEYCHKQSFSWGFQEGVNWILNKIKENGNLL